MSLADFEVLFSMSVHPLELFVRGSLMYWLLSSLLALSRGAISARSGWATSCSWF
jgi:hypothetical protein